MEIEDLKVLKLKLFEHLDSAEVNVSLSAASLLVQLASVANRDLQEKGIGVMQLVVERLDAFLADERAGGK